MSHKNKNSQTVSDKFNVAAMRGGLILMTAAATLGMIELPEHPNKVGNVPAQPAFAVAAPAAEHSEEMRREKEETHPHHLSFSTTQRTHARSGRA